MVTVLFITVVPAVIFSITNPMHVNTSSGIVAGYYWQCRLYLKTMPWF
jgi:hypothetical protein